MKKKKYAIVGLGNRSRMFSDTILTEYRDRCELVGLCDLNRTRMDYHAKRYQKEFGVDALPRYGAEQFDTMVSETKPDVVIVTTMDRTHHTYICRAMELGCDVITEKPMTTDEEKCRRIFQTKERTGRDLTVTFNYRYSPRNAKIKELIQAGEIGRVVSVHFEWLLNTSHGADYFRRWHRDKHNSGGLMVHKATHHFDLVNWWIDASPAEVFGMGRLAFYGRENAEQRGVTRFYDRCYGSEYAKTDPFALNLQDGGKLENLYLKAEQEDGYIRDRSVFSQGISIEDTMSVLVRYNTRATLTYSLNAFCPWEGYRVAFNGTKGRLSADIVEAAYVAASTFDQNDPDFNQQQKAPAGKRESERITLQKLFETPQDITWDEGEGGHGGGDKRLCRDIFAGVDNDPLGMAAGPLDGAKSIMVGIAANRSFDSGRPVRVDDLFPLSRYLNE